jgi:hypothetical protein
MLDSNTSVHKTVTGWAFVTERECPSEDIVVGLRELSSEQWSFFTAWRTPRRDVADFFRASNLLISGFRAYVDLPPGTYEIKVVQQSADSFTEAVLGEFNLAAESL